MDREDDVLYCIDTFRSELGATGDVVDGGSVGLAPQELRRMRGTGVACVSGYLEAKDVFRLAVTSMVRDVRR